MPFSNLPVPPFVTVPLAPGVPAVNRLQNAIVPIITEVESDLASLASFFSGPQWGLFDSSGNVALTADTVMSFEFMREWNVPSYPIEPNGFQNYNKVEVPYEAKVLFAIGGTVEDRISFLADCDGVCASTDLFTVATPEALYVNVNPHHYDYRRTTRNGANVLLVEIFCVKIRTSATSTYSNTQQPSGADPTSGGNLQPQDTDLNLSNSGVG